MEQREFKELASGAQFLSNETDRMLQLLKESCNNLKGIYEKSKLPSDLQRYEESLEQYKEIEQGLQETKKRLTDFVQSIDK